VNLKQINRLLKFYLYHTYSMERIKLHPQTFNVVRK
jgi:hypothetical protein